MTKAQRLARMREVLNMIERQWREMTMRLRYEERRD